MTKEKELTDAVKDLRRSVEALAVLVKEQNELTRKALLLEQRRQLIHSSALIAEARPTGLELEARPGPSAGDGTV